MGVTFPVAQILVSPKMWILPFGEVDRFKRSYRTRTNVSRAAIRAEGVEFENAWHLIAGPSEAAG